MTYTVINKVDRKYVNSLVRGDRMKITYDPGADALYIAFIDNDKSDRVNGEWPFNVDITSDNKALGIEILEASSMFKQEFLDQYK